MKGRKFPAGKGSIPLKLQRAVKHLFQEEFQEALDITLPILEQFPNNRQALFICLEGLSRSDQDPEALELVARLLTENPDLDRETADYLFPVLLKNGYDHLARQIYEQNRRYGKRSATVLVVEENLAQFESDMGPVFKADLDTKSDEFLAETLLERAEILLITEKNELALACLKKAHQLNPHSDEISKALADTFWTLGKIPDSQAFVQQWRQETSENLASIAYALRQASLLGQAPQRAELLEHLTKGLHSEVWLPAASVIIYSLAYAGEYRRCIDFYEGLPAADQEIRESCYAPAAFAYDRLGQKAKATSLWEKLHQEFPDHPIYEQNIADQKLPADQRWGSFLFVLSEFIPSPWLRHFDQVGGPGKSETEIAASASRVLQLCPGLDTILANSLHLLGHDDAWFAVGLGFASQSAILLEAIDRFQKNQLGSAELRQMIEGSFQELSDDEVQIPVTPIKALAGPHQTWYLSEEPTTHHSPEIGEQMHLALTALRDKKPAIAIKILEPLLAASNRSPDVLNNLALAYQLKQQAQKATPLIAEIHEKHPDYLFGRIIKANNQISQQDYAAARRTLEPLFEREVFHITEMSALADLMCQICLYTGNYRKLKAWKDLLTEVDSDHPSLEAFDIISQLGKASKKLLKASKTKPTPKPAPKKPVPAGDDQPELF